MVYDWQNEYKRWLDAVGDQPDMRVAFEALDTDALREDAFYTELEFGTAGLRGVIGAGTNRMNRYVVRRASAGLALAIEQLEGQDAKQRGVAIAYDSRNLSDVFAMETALTLCAYGIKCYLYSSLRSVPQLSFTIRHLNCIAGVVITASHNPPEYNGYKVYWQDGGQCAPDRAGEILNNIRKVDYFEVEPMDYALALSSGMLTIIGTEVDEQYYANAKTLLLHPDVLAAEGDKLKVVYSPLHGSGNVPVRAVLQRVGVTNVAVVPEQELPDGSFPTVKAPNPEDKNAFTLAKQLACEIGADLMLATDPDSDRLGAGILTPDGNYLMLTGNQIGALLCYYKLSSMAESGTLPENGLVVKSFVSTALADAVCKKYGVTIKDVLTGFRYISEWIERCEATGEYNFLFGFEESYGSLAGTFARDKDAICAAMLMCEAAVWYGTNGKSLYDVLQDIYREFGCFSEAVKSYTLSGKSGMEQIANAMQQFRNAPLCDIAGLNVEVYEDHLAQTKLNRLQNTSEPTGLPKSNALRYLLPGSAWVVVRPSGTEPKLKLYIGAAGNTSETCEAQAKELLGYMDDLLGKLLNK